MRIYVNLAGSWAVLSVAVTKGAGGCMGIDLFS